MRSSMSTYHMMRQARPLISLKLRESKARSAEDGQLSRVSETIDCYFTIISAVEVHIGIAERTTGSHIAAYANRCDWAHSVEQLEKLSLANISSEVANAENKPMQSQNAFGTKIRAY